MKLQMCMPPRKRKASETGNRHKKAYACIGNSQDSCSFFMLSASLECMSCVFHCSASGAVSVYASVGGRNM